jgi:Nucleoside 2-deoxyribosyltransferase.
LYSAAIRELYEVSGREVWVEDLEVLLASVSVPQSPIDKIDRLLVYIARNTSTLDAGVIYDYTLFPIAYGKTENELHAFIRMAKDHGGYLTTGSIGDPILLTMAGWRRVEEVSKAKRDSARAFVAMSFDKALFEVWTHGFYPALNQVGYDPIRVDTEQTNHKIDNKIIADIRKCGLVIADFTGQSNGVYYEAGFAEGLGLDVVYSVRDTDIKKLHFDTRQYSHIVWTDIPDLRKQLIDRVEATLPNRPRLSKESWVPID